MKPPRTIGKNICYHVRVQCNNKEFRFETSSDFHLYEEMVQRYQKKYGFHLYNYVLMHTHVHLIVNVINDFTIDRIMRSINQVFSFKYNRIKNRFGHLWISPYRSSVVDGDEYALCCMRYLDRNPVRAGIVTTPTHWRWGGFNYYAYGKENPLITPLPLYLDWAKEKFERNEKYKQFVEQILPSDAKRDKEWIQSKWPKAKHR